MTPTDRDQTVFQTSARNAAVELLPQLKSNRNALRDPGPMVNSRPLLGGCRPSGVAEYKGMTFDSPLVPWKQMTYEEKLMLLGYPANNPPIVLAANLAIMAYGQYRNTHATSLDVLFIPNAHLMTIENMAFFLSSRISPITGKLIEIDHHDFSSGNAYVRVVTEEEVKELVAKDPSVDEWWNYAVMSGGTNDPKDVRVTLTGKEVKVDPRFTPQGKHDPWLVYVKLYGTSGVLYEGLM